MPTLLFAEVGLPGAGVGVLLLLIVFAILAALVAAAIVAAFVLAIVYFVRTKSTAVKVTIASLLLLLVVLPTAWYVSLLPGKDYQQLKRGAYIVWPADESHWRFVRPFVAGEEPDPWARLTEEIRPEELRPTQILQPEQFANILARHPELRRIELGPRSTQPIVMRQLAVMPHLQIVKIHSGQPLPDDWTKAFPASAAWVDFEITTPGLSPAGAVRILERCQNLERLGMPQAAMDEAVCVALFNHPKISRISLYQPDGDQPLEDTIQVRLQRRFPKNFEIRPSPY